MRFRSSLGEPGGGPQRLCKVIAPHLPCLGVGVGRRTLDSLWQLSCIKVCESCKESTGLKEGQRTRGEGRGCKGSIVELSSPEHH